MEVFIVAGNPKAKEFLMPLLQQMGDISKITFASSGSEARRMMIDNDFDLVLIHAPLRDEFGAELAGHISETTASGILLMVKNELADSVSVLLKRLGAKYVVVRARSEIECDLLRKVGADEIVYADGNATDKLAVRMGGNNIFDYIELTGGYAIFEVPVLKAWEGKTIAELEVRKRYKINIVAIKNDDMLDPTPMPDYRFKADDHILVIGKSRDVFKLDAKNG